MTEKKTRSIQAADLRKQAEDIVRKQAIKSHEGLDGMSPEETRRALHELRVHQVELEIQNEELRQTQRELEAARTRYFDLYDLAPVGYVTLSEQGLILETNLTAATLLGVRRADLVGRPLSRFIPKEEQGGYYLHLRQLFETGEPQICEMRMMKKDGMALWVRMEATTAQDDDGTTLCRAAISDITAERKQVENALRELKVKIGEEALYHSLVDMASEGFWLLDKEFLTVYVNRALEDLLGYAKEELIGRSWYDFGDPEWVDRPKELEKNRVSGVKEPHPFLFIRKNGSKVLTRIATTPIYDDEGNFYGTLGILSDITSQKEAEDALRVKDLAIKSAMNAIAMSDLEGNLTYVNPAFLKLWGYINQEEILGKSLMGSWHMGENAAGIMEILHARGSWSGESVAKNKHGTPFDVLVSSSMVENVAGESICMLALFADISDRKRAEDLLRKSEERFDQLAKQSGTIVWEVDTEGLYTYVSPVSETILGYRPDELVGHMHFYDLHPETGKKIFKRAAFAVFDRKEPFLNLENVGLTKDGRHVWFSTNGIPLLNTDGTMQGYRGSDTDITNRKLAEEKLKKSQELEELILSSVPHGLFGVVNREIFFTNDAIKNVSGWEPEELKGKSTRILFRNDQEWEEYGAMLYSMIKNESVVSFDPPMPLIRKDGSEIYCRTSASRIGGDLTAGNQIVAMIEDITERKRSAEALQKSERQMADIIEFLPDATLAINKEGLVIIWNKAIEEMTDVPAAEMIGKGDYAYTIPFYGEARPQLMDLVFDDDDEIAAKYPQVTREGDALIVEVFCHALYDNKGAWVLAKASPLHDQSGNVIGAIESIRDITKQKQAELSLRLFKDLVEHSSDAIGISTPEGKHYYQNKAFDHLFGDIGDNPTETVYVDKAIGKQVFDTIMGGRSWQGEVEMYKNDRTILNIFLRAYAIKNQNDGIIGLVGLNTDITNIKNIEKELKQSEFRYRTVTRLISDFAYSCIHRGEEGYVLDWITDSFFTITGFSKREAYDQQCWIPWAHPDDLEMATEPLRSLKPGETDTRDFRFITKDGRELVFLNRIECERDKESSTGIRIFGAVRDMTESKRADEEMKDSWKRLTDIIDFLPDATLVIDNEGKVIAWNRAIEAMTGVKAEDMLGKGNYEYAIPFYGERRPILIDIALHPEPGREKDYTTIQRSGDIVFGESYTPKLAPGNVHLSATSSVLRNAKGEIIAAIECIRNNTDRKNMEERLNRAEKMESLGTLAGGVAHDLNNVLGIVVGYAEMLMDEMDEANPMRDDMKKILEGGNRSAAIVHDLLTLARRGVHTKKTVNLNTTIMDCQKLPEFEKVFSYNARIKLQTDLELDLLNIMGSPVHLAKSIINLASNAVEAMPNGGVLKIATSNQYLDMPIHGYDNVREGDYVVLTVSDTGEGILERDIKRIFEPFYTKKIMGRSGTGLGLAVVWGTIKDHNGYINVESEEGKGTIFTLYFPVTRQDIASDQISVSMSEYMGRGETILVVDDINRQRELASRMLTKLNYSVKTVASGEEAIEYLRKNKADLVILDMIMDPGIDGLETYEKILEINPVQRAVIVSGFSESDRVKEAQKIGAGAYVPKPYVLERLGIAVRKELDRK